MKKNRILCVAQLPPPVHGASLMNSYLIDSKILNEKFIIKSINSTAARDTSDIEKFAFRKVAKAITLICSIIKQLVSFKPDLVYFTLSPSGFAFYRDAAIVIIIKLFRTRIVFHLHGKGISKGASKSAVFRKICKIIFHNTHVIFLSKSLIKDAQEFIDTSYYIVNNSIPVINTENYKRRFSSEAKLLFLSNYVRTKGIIELIEAVEKIVPEFTAFHLKLVGKPFDVTIPYLENLITQKKLEKYITVCGPMYNEEKYQVLSESDIFILPTYYSNEAFPISILEAMQFELPVISTYEGGIPDMIENGVNGFLVDKQNVTQLAEKILFLLKNEATRNAMKKEAKRHFQQKYTISHFERNISAAFEDILK